MREPSPSRKTSRKQTEIDRVVEEVVADAHLDAATLRADERQYLEDHALKKPMGVLHIWALGVGAVITGEYFGWNPGLKEGGRSACCWPRCSCAPCTWRGCWP